MRGGGGLVLLACLFAWLAKYKRILYCFLAFSNLVHKYFLCQELMTRKKREIQNRNPHYLLKILKYFIFGSVSRFFLRKTICFRFYFFPKIVWYLKTNWNLERWATTTFQWNESLIIDTESFVIHTYIVMHAGAMFVINTIIAWINLSDSLVWVPII